MPRRRTTRTPTQAEREMDQALRLQMLVTKGKLFLQLRRLDGHLTPPAPAHGLPPVRRP